MRHERLTLTACLTPEGRDRYADQVATILTAPEATARAPDDQRHLDLAYTLHLDYFGRTAQRVQAFTELVADPEVVLAVDLAELEHGTCLLQDLAARLAQCQAVLRARRAPEETA